MAYELFSPKEKILLAEANYHHECTLAALLETARRNMNQNPVVKDILPIDKKND